LGVCTVFAGDELAITCPVRLRQDLLIVSDAAQFFFPQAQHYIALTEVRLNDQHGKSAGNIDIVIVEIDAQGELKNFGALKVQAVYISGNVSKAFKKYMEDPASNHTLTWPAKNYPKPDYLSSSRKRLAPQLIYKGGILNAWQKKMAVAVHRAFFATLPKMPQIEPAQAEIAWFIYDLVFDETANRYFLKHSETQYTRFQDALNTITMPHAANVTDFETYLKERIRKGQVMGQPQPAETSPELEPLPEIFTEED
jgi:hypothetical protein